MAQLEVMGKVGEMFPPCEGKSAAGLTGSDGSKFRILKPSLLTVVLVQDVVNSGYW